MPHYHNKKETKKIGLHILSLRKQRNLSVEDIVDMTGFTRALIIGVENGKNTDTSHLIEIAKAIGVHPMEIFNIAFDLKPRFKLSPKRQQREFLTQKIKQLVADTDFFYSPKLVSDVVERISQDYDISASSTIISVLLKREVSANKLSFKKNGRKNAYLKRKR